MIYSFGGKKGEIGGATDLLDPRQQADKSSTSHEHQWHWRTPHPGQCKHTHSVREIGRYHCALANTQMEDRRTPPLTRCHPLLSLLL